MSKQDCELTATKGYSFSCRQLWRDNSDAWCDRCQAMAYRELRRKEMEK